MSGKDKTGHSYEGDDADRDYCYASVNTPGTPLTQPCGQTRAAHVPDKTVRADKTVGGRIDALARELAEIADETLSSDGDTEVYEREMATLRERFKSQLLLAFDSRGVRDGLERAAKWQPIETAPKDGTWVLVYSASWKDAPPEVAQYDESFGWYMPGHEEPNEVLTHWLPLPAAPALRAEASKLDGGTMYYHMPHEFDAPGPRDSFTSCRSCGKDRGHEQHIAPEPPAEERKLPHRFAPPQDAEDDRCQFCFGCTINETGDHTCSGKRKCGQPRSAHEPRESS
jgi:hypothetical protein